jgi:hypothetical protein
MYISILILPFLGSLVSGLLGRKIGVTGAHLITCTCLILSSILATIAFYEVGICGSPVSIHLVNWIDSEFMSISWEFLFDQLTVSMFIPVLYISSLIHIFSTDYMSEDPHNQRFFSYLSLFTFFMLILVSGANYFVMFVGWEGNLNCLKWLNNLSNTVIFPFNISKKWNRTIFTESSKLVSSNRIGPHNIDIISIIVGSVLGDSHLEKRSNGIGTRIIFEQSNKNVEYLMWFHSYLSTRGYCNINKPKLKIRIRKKGEIFFHCRINSYTFSSFNWIHDMFYTPLPALSLRSVRGDGWREGKYVKIIPSDIDTYLNPVALAIWFMDDGCKLQKGAKIASNCFTYKELSHLCEILNHKFNLKVSIHSGGKNKGHTLFISSQSMPTFSKIIKPYMIPSLYYKLGDY